MAQPTLPPKFKRNAPLEAVSVPLPNHEKSLDSQVELLGRIDVRYSTLITYYKSERPKLLPEHTGKWVVVFFRDSQPTIVTSTFSEEQRDAFMQQLEELQTKDLQLCYLVGMEGKVQHHACAVFSIPMEVDPPVSSQCLVTVKFGWKLQPGGLGFEIWRTAHAMIDSGCSQTLINSCYAADFFNFFSSRKLKFNVFPGTVNSISGPRPSLRMYLFVQFAGKEHLMAASFVDLGNLQQGGWGALVGCDILSKGILTINHDARKISFGYHEDL